MDTGTRRQYLNGMWEFYPAAEGQHLHVQNVLQSQTNLEFETIQVPSYWNTFPDDTGGDWDAYDNFQFPKKWNQAKCALYRLRFHVQKEQLIENGRYILNFDAISGKSSFYLNGTPVGQPDHDLFLPVSFDVTAQIRLKEENEILVLVEEPEKDESGLWLQPPGSWAGWHLRGIWQDVYLETKPVCAIDNAFIQTLLSEKKMIADATISNHTDQELSGTLHLEIRDGDTVLHSAEAGITIPCGKGNTHSIEIPWADPIPWSPDNPKLYDSSIHLVIEGQPEHTVQTRFGFREFDIEGTQFTLNGNPIRLFGDSWHYMGAAQQNIDYARTWFRLVKELGGNAVRTHAMPYPPCYFDAADEMGILIIDESALYGSAGSLALENNLFWERTHDHQRRLVLRDRNHPSVVMWSASNEVVWKGGEVVFPHLLSLRDATQKLDTTRPVSYDENDSDLGGGADIHGGHYGTPAHWDSSWKREKPLMVNEFCSLYHGGPNESSPWVGETGYTDYFERWLGSGEEASDMFLALRRLGAGSITPWNVNWYSMQTGPEQSIDLAVPDASGPGVKIKRIGEHSLTLNYAYEEGQKAWKPNPAYRPIREAYLPQRFWIRKSCFQWYNGTRPSIPLTIFNDTPVKTDFRLEAKLSIDDKKPKTLPGVDATVKPFSHVDLNLLIKIPDADDHKVGQLELTLIADGNPEPVFIQTEECLLYNGWKPGEFPKKEMTTIAFSGGTETDESRLNTVGFNIARVVQPGDPIPQNVNTLLLGARQDAPTLSAWMESAPVKKLLSRDGTVVVLPGSVSHDPACPMQPLDRQANRLFFGDLESPLLESLNESDFQDWDENGNTAIQTYIRPDKGACESVLDIGDATDGMPYSALLLVPREKGTVIFCGMDLLEHNGTIPAATELLCSLATYQETRYLSRPVFRTSLPDRTTALLEDAIGNIHEEKPDYESESIWIIDGSNKTVLEEVIKESDKVQSYVKTGGVLVVMGASPETQKLVSDLTGSTVNLQDDERFNAGRNEESWLYRGVNQYDLCWVERGDKCPLVTHSLPTDESRAESHIQSIATRWEDYQMAHEQHKAGMMLRRIHSFKAPRDVVSSFASGEGVVVLCQIRFDLVTEAFADRARRILSRMLANLGAAHTTDPLSPLSLEEQAVDRDGYIKRWLILGSFESPDSNPIDVPFIDESGIRPAEGMETKGKTWTVHTSGWPQIDLRQPLGDQAKDHAAGYAAVYIHSNRDRSILLDTPEMVTLSMGADDGAKIWLNGEEIGRFDFVRKLVLDQNRMDGIPLKEGWNLLLVKLAEYSGNWQFAARLISTAGGAVTGLKFSTQPE